MAECPETRVFKVKQATALVDPTDDQVGQIGLRTETQWFHFRLPRRDFELLGREILRALQDAEHQ